MVLKLWTCGQSEFVLINISSKYDTRWKFSSCPVDIRAYTKSLWLTFEFHFNFVENINRFLKLKTTNSTNHLLYFLSNCTKLATLQFMIIYRRLIIKVTTLAISEIAKVYIIQYLSNISWHQQFLYFQT